MKRSSSIKCLIVLSLFLFSPLFVYSQKSYAEGWEKSTETIQPPYQIMDSAGLKKGMTVGEIGAGRGRITVYLADRVGPGGFVYANDIDASALGSLRSRCERLGFNNVKTVLGGTDDPSLPESSLDMAFMVWVFHHLEKPELLIRNLKKSLKPGATLIIIDPTDNELESSARTTDPIRERVMKVAGTAGYEVLRTETFLPEDYFYVLKVKDK